MTSGSPKSNGLQIESAPAIHTYYNMAHSSINIRQTKKTKQIHRSRNYFKSRLKHALRDVLKKKGCVHMYIHLTDVDSTHNLQCTMLLSTLLHLLHLLSRRTCQHRCLCTTGSSCYKNFSEGDLYMKKPRYTMI